MLQAHCSACGGLLLIKTPQRCQPQEGLLPATRFHCTHRSNIFETKAQVVPIDRGLGRPVHAGGVRIAVAAKDCMRAAKPAPYLTPSYLSATAADAQRRTEGRVAGSRPLRHLCAHIAHSVTVRITRRRGHHKLRCNNSYSLPGASELLLACASGQALHLWAHSTPSVSTSHSMHSFAVRCMIGCPGRPTVP